MPSVDLEQCCVELSRPQPLLGSAAVNTTMIWVDCPKPWNAKVQDSSGFHPAALQALEDARAEGMEFALQARAPVGDLQPQILVYRRLGGRTVMRSWALDFEHMQEQMLEWMRAEATDADTAEPALFVCTHGSRDACCARLGVPILQKARELGAPVHESSHLGGHRFAPTLFLMPEWRCYGRIEDFATFWEGEPIGRLDWLRGTAYLVPQGQVIEGELARRRGSWPDHSKVLEIRPVGNSQRVRIEAHFGDEVVEVEGLLAVESFRGPLSCSDVPIGLSKESETFRLTGELTTR